MTLSAENKKIIANFPNNRISKILITLLVFLFIMGIIACIVISSGSIGYINIEQRQLSQEVIKDSKVNYIEALYNCPGNNETCKFYNTFSKFYSPISSISIDGEIVPVQYYHKFKNRCQKSHYQIQ